MWLKIVAVIVAGPILAVPSFEHDDELTLAQGGASWEPERFGALRHPSDSRFLSNFVGIIQDQRELGNR